MPDEVITAVVCTHNRADLLPKCLDSLVNQALARKHLILVIDNASTDATAEITRQYAASHAHLRYVYEPTIGLSRARNRALEEIDTPYIAYIDDDAIAQPDWLEQILTPFETIDPSPAIVCGELDPAWEIDPPAWLKPEFWHKLSVCLNWSKEPRFLTSNEWAPEGNSAYRADLLREAGSFAENLGRKGPLLLSGENFVHEIIIHKGGRIFFNPQARVTHFVAKERLTVEWMRNRYFWGGVTAAIVEKERVRHFGGDGRWSDVALPASSWEWADIINGQPDVRLTHSLHLVYNVGYCLGRMGFFPL